MECVVCGSAGRFGTERVHRSGLPPVPLSRLRQGVCQDDHRVMPTASPRMGTAGICVRSGTTLGAGVRHRDSQYLNNQLEQDHFGHRQRSITRN